MRLALLFCFMCSYALLNAQTFSGQFDPRELITYPSFTDTARVEYDSLGKAFLVEGRPDYFYRKAEAKKVDGKWLADGKDSIWFSDYYQMAVYSVKRGIPHGRFTRIYSTRRGEDSYTFSLSGKYKHGKLHGKYKTSSGDYFHCVNGILDGKYKLYNIETRFSETGQFKNGLRDGIVEVPVFNDSVIQLEYQMGYLVKANIPNLGRSHYISRIQGSAGPRNGDWMLRLYNDTGILCEEIQYFGIQDISKLCFNLYGYNYGNSQYRTVSGEVDSIRVAIVKETRPSFLDFSRSISWYYGRSERVDTLFPASSDYHMIVHTRNGLKLFFNEEGVLASVKLNYTIKHDIQSCLYGIYDKRDSVILPIEYEEIYWSSPIGFIVKKDGLYGAFSWDGKEVFPPSLNQLLVIPTHRDPEDPDYELNNTRELYVNTTILGGKVYPEFELIAQVGNKWGIINQKGEWVLSCEHDKLYREGEIIYKIEKNRKYLFKKQGNNYVLHPHSYKDIHFAYPYYRVEEETRNWGIIDNKLNLILKTEYQSITTHSDLFILTLNSKNNDQVIILDKDLKPWIQDTLIGYPYFFPRYIELRRYKKGDRLIGFAGYSSKVWVESNYTNLNFINTYQNHESHPSPLFKGKLHKTEQYYLFDTLGHQIGPYKSIDVLWPNVEYNKWPFPPFIPPTYLFAVSQDSSWDLTDISGNSKLPSYINQKSIDRIWTTNTIGFIKYTDTLKMYSIQGGELEPMNWEKDKNTLSQLGFQKLGDYMAFQNWNGLKGIVNCETGHIYEPAIYSRIEVDGEEFVLHFGKNKQIRIIPGMDRTLWHSYPCYFNLENAFAVGTFSRKMGIVNHDAKLLVDTVYDEIHFFKQNKLRYFFAKKGDSLFTFNHQFKQTAPGLKIRFKVSIDEWASQLEFSDNTKGLFLHKDSALINADMVYRLYSNYSLVHYSKNRLYGAINTKGKYKIPARYTALWEFYPFIAMRDNKFALLDSDGRELGLYDTNTFCRAPIPEYMVRNAQFYSESGINETKNTRRLRPEQKLIWNDKLLFLLCLAGRDIANIPLTQGHDEAILIYRPDSSESRTYVNYYKHDLHTAFYHFPVRVSYKSDELLSAVRPKSGHRSEAFRFNFDNYWMSPDSVLKKLQLSEFIQDESMLASMLTKEFIRLNFQIDQCPDLAMLYPLYKKNFYLKKEGLCFAIELVYGKYGEVLLKWEDLKPIIKKQPYLNTLLSK